MDKPKLLIRTGKLSEFLEKFSPLALFDMEEMLLDDGIFFDITLQQYSDRVGVFLLDTPNTRVKHDGQWRFIFSMQGIYHDYGDRSFTYFEIPNVNNERIILRLEESFELEYVQLP